MSVNDRPPESTDAELPDVPDDVDAIRSPTDENKTLIYDKSHPQETAWIQGYTVNPENLKTGW